MKILNSKEDAISGKSWGNPGAKFYDKICHSKEALREAYLVVGDIEKDTPFARSGCKYPHHSLNGNGDLVLNVAGVKAAYSRAKQMGIFKGDVKVHLVRHYKELGIYKDSEMAKEDKITENFDFIENYLGIDESSYYKEEVEQSSIEELEEWIDNVAHNGFTAYTEASHGSLKYCYRIGFDKSTGEQVAVEFELKPDEIVPPDKNVTGTTLGQIANANGWPEERIKGALAKQAESLKKNIKKIGYIDFVSKSLPVHAIFTRYGHQALNSVKLIPFLSNEVREEMNKLWFDKDLFGEDPNQEIKFDDRCNAIMKSDKFKKIIKNKNIPVETYEVGKPGGDNKYKTTKLIWKNGLFSSHALTPALRGKIKYGSLMPDNDYVELPSDKGMNMFLKKQGVVKLKELKEYVAERANDLDLFSITPDMEYEEMVQTLLTEQAECDKGSALNYGFNVFEYSRISDIQDLLNFMEDAYNESFWDELEDASLSFNIPHDQESLLIWMDKIEYDKSIKDWRLKSPKEVKKTKLGNCHDQSLFALYMLDKFGYSCGQLFFIELNEGETVGGNTHTLTWYKEADKYYWFEHSWENYRGIHGPYSSLEELKVDVYKSWGNDNDINSKKYERIEFFDKPHYEIGMSLGEYVDSWTQDDIMKESVDEFNETNTDPVIEKKWFITSDDGVDNCCIKVNGYDKPMRGRSSMITLRHMLGDWYVMSKKNNGGDYGVPGGGWNKDEDPMDAAIRELHEEVQSNATKVRRMGTLIEYHEDVAQWVKDHVPNPDDWWYGYYSTIFVGIYDGVFEGEVEDRDKETGYGFKPLKVVIDQFPKEYQDAIVKYICNKYYQESVFTEKSHGNLKYCYRVGFDKDTLEEVAVQFELIPDKITGVGDKNLTASVLGKRDDDNINSIHNKALDLVKNNIKKFGNIDFKSEALPVMAIFSKSGNSLQKVSLIPLFNDIITEIVRSYSKRNPNINTNELFQSENFKRDLKAKLNDPRIKQEEIYEVGKVGGADKYKTTKLMWGYDQMLAYKFTPVLRGFTPPGRGYNQNDMKNYLDKNLNNKFTGTLKEYVETVDSMMEVFNDHWGSTACKVHYMGDTVMDIYEKYGNPDIASDMSKVYLDAILPSATIFTEADENDPPELDEPAEEKPEEVKEEPKQEETPAEEPANDDIMNDFVSEEPPELDEPAEEPTEEPQQEEPKEAPKEEPKPEKPMSMPKQTDAAEKGKNGVNRKKLYIAFIEWCKDYNSKNTFGSIFDKDIFHNVYPFVPEEMRYFYRLANPILCVLGGELTFFQVSELRVINKKNSKMNELLIFAATPNDLRVFNIKDKKVYRATEENSNIVLGDLLGETFDLYIQNMIKKGDILNAPLGEEKEGEV